MIGPFALRVVRRVFAQAPNVFFESGLFIVVAPSFFDRFEFIRCFFMVVARALPQSHYRQGVAVEVASRPQAVRDLIAPDGFLHLRALRTVCLAAIVALRERVAPALRQRSNSSIAIDRCSHWDRSTLQFGKHWNRSSPAIDRDSCFDRNPSGPGNRRSCSSQGRNCTNSDHTRRSTSRSHHLESHSRSSNRPGSTKATTGKIPH